MAERTGIPELDRLLDSFLVEYGALVSPLRDPRRAYDQCGNVSHWLSTFLRVGGCEAGYRPYAPQALGYEDAPGVEGLTPFDDHVVCFVCAPDEAKTIFAVDFTAAQFGYTEFPLVQRLLDGVWQRSW